MGKYIFVVDVDRCMGCQGCMISCKLENEIALGAYRNFVCKVGPEGEYPHMEMYFLPVMCQQCELPGCTAVCPTGACYKDLETGLVRINREQCIACGCCVKACPYGVITFDKERRAADKCDACRGSGGDDPRPACVRNCAGSALYFGDIEDPDSEVSRVLKGEKKENIYTLHNDGNQPSHRYILRRFSWRDVDISTCEGWKGGGEKA